MDLNTLWFVLIGILISGYAILDGFDLGVGALHLFARDDHERHIHVKAIGPVWDGNEVWLIVAGGALFAAFPAVYATFLSAFYLLFMMLLLSLIFRAVSIEFRSRVSSPVWQHFWDFSFGLGSLSASLLYGIMAGNILSGIPIGKEGVVSSNFLSLLNLHSIITGLLTLTIFVMHGGIYMTLKTEGVLLGRMRKYVYLSWLAFTILYPVALISTYSNALFLFKVLMSSPLPWIVFILLVAVVIYIPVGIKKEKYFRSFLASSAIIGCVLMLTGLGLFPMLIPSSIDHVYSLTIYNASAGPRTLAILLIIALISLPLVTGFTVYIHRVFKGKVDASEESHY